MGYRESGPQSTGKLCGAFGSKAVSANLKPRRSFSSKAFCFLLTCTSILFGSGILSPARGQVALMTVRSIASTTAGLHALLGAPIYDRGGESVDVNARNLYLWVYRSQGISVEISPDRHWWCLWICTTTTDVDSIQFTILLEGQVLPPVRASASCTNCGSMNVVGWSGWGAGVPQAYQRVTYNGTVKIKGVPYAIEGVTLF
jgi:hypothetical protein